MNEGDRMSGGTSAAEVVRRFLGGGLSRRDFVQKALILGVSSAAIGAALEACSTSAAPTGSSSSGFDPKKYAGTQVNILMTGDENDHRALGDMLPQLESETGIKVQITAPALGALINKTLENLKASRSDFDLVEYLGFLTTQQVGAGYFERLNPYIDDPKETPSDWDFKDFVPANVDNVGRYDIAAKKLGSGNDLYGIPGLHSGSVIYWYRKDLFTKAGIKPATTWDEFKDAAMKLNSKEVAGCSFIGANDFSLATVDWYTRFLTTGGKLMSGSPQTKDFKPNLNSSQSVGALQMLIDLLPYAPKNVTQYGFSDNVDGFSSGKIAQMVFWSTIAGPIFNPDKSKVADKTATSKVPAAAGSTSQAILGGWGLGIPKNSDPAKKKAAWRALTWMTSKKFNNFEASKYQIDASRTSTFADPSLIQKFPYLPDAGYADSHAKIIETSILNEFFDLNAVMNVEFNKALIGGQSASAACAATQTQWETILKKGGYLA